MAELTRPVKVTRLSYDATCRSCGRSLPAGTLAYWAPIGITWCLSCPTPDACYEPFEDTRTLDDVVNAMNARRGVA